MPLPPEAARVLGDLGRFGIHLGLDHVRRLAAALGEPQLAVPSVLVAGTNGKGSTAALLASMAAAGGLSTGLYTSPHLEDVTERLRLGGGPVDGGALSAAVLAVVAAARRLPDGPPTYFEALTAAAWLVLRDAAVDLAVTEVGLGGRLDATNVAEPLLSVVTPIALEHQALLGDTLGAVAREKAGVLRRGRPAVAWGGEPEVRRALAAAATEAGAELGFVDDEVRIMEVEARAPVPWGGLRVVLETPVRRYALETPLAGRHQAVNLALAVRAAERLGEVAGGLGLALGEEAIRRGAAEVRWPGRLESVEVPGAPGEPARRVVLDAAHNPAGAEALAAFLDEAAAVAGEGAPRPVLVFGVLREKQAEGMLPPLALRAGRVVLTRPSGERGRDPRELLPLLPPGGDLDVKVEPDPGRAVERALASSGGGTVVVCGSIFLVGTVRGWLRERFGVPGA